MRSRRHTHESALAVNQTALGQVRRPNVGFPPFPFCLEKNAASLRRQGGGWRAIGTWNVVGPEVVVSGDRPALAADTPSGGGARESYRRVGRVRSTVPPRDSGGSRTASDVAVARVPQTRPSPARNRSRIGLNTSVLATTASPRDGSAAGIDHGHAGLTPKVPIAVL